MERLQPLRHHSHQQLYKAEHCRSRQLHPGSTNQSSCQRSRRAGREHTLMFQPDSEKQQVSSFYAQTIQELKDWFSRHWLIDNNINFFWRTPCEVQPSDCRGAGCDDDQRPQRPETFSLASNHLQFDPLIWDLPQNTTWWVRRSHMTRVSCSLMLGAPEGSVTQNPLQTLHILHPPSTSERQSFCQTLVCLWKRLQMIFRAAESLFKPERVVRSSFIHSFSHWMSEFWSNEMWGWEEEPWLAGRSC